MTLRYADAPEVFNRLIPLLPSYYQPSQFAYTPHTNTYNSQSLNYFQNPYKNRTEDITMQMAQTVTFQYPNGDRYVGEISSTIDGRVVASGMGTRYYVNGDVYNGGFLNDQFQGYGKYKSLNGDYYKGYYYQNLRHGQGESYQVSIQRRYTGGFCYGVEDGYAVVTRVDFAANGGHKKYVGYMKNGRRHGPGKLTFTAPDGHPTEFDGQWVNDVLHGPGRQNHPIQCFAGQFVYGKLEGPGTRTDTTTGLTYAVTFQRGIPV
jgi:hypothetical protein